jgi:hypothetical protein
MERQPTYNTIKATDAKLAFTDADRKRYTFYFILVFYALAIYKLINGMWLFQNTPFAFRPYFDGSLWMFLQTGMHQWLLYNTPASLAMDLMFYLLPAVYYFVFLRNIKTAAIVAACMLFFNPLYVWCYTVFPTNSIEGHTAWLFTPVLFLCVTLTGFYLWMHALRYFFLFFFFSAALWKFYQGGVFEPMQMSGILLEQHKDLLATDPQGWYTSFIYWLIQHPVAGKLFYVAATGIELVFVIGFFTRRFDRLLLLLFCIFLVMDVLVMKIPYYEVLCLTLPFLFSRKTDPV